MYNIFAINFFGDVWTSHFGFFFVYFKYIHSYDILGARMLWKPKEARILKNFIEF